MDYRMRRALVKILILVPLGILASFLATVPGGIVSYSPATRVGVHSLLAFWISIPASLVLLAYLRQKLRAHILLLSALVFSIMLHIGSAASNLIILQQESVERLLVHTVSDFLDLALIGIILIFAGYCYRRQELVSENRQSRWIFVTIIFLLPLIIFGSFWFFIFPVLSDSMLITLSYILAIIAIVGLIASIELLRRIKFNTLPLDIGYLTSSLLLLALSAIALLTTLPNYQQGWELAETMQMAAFFVFCLALGIPYLRRYGYSRRGAYVFGIGLILIAYFPFVVTIAIESFQLSTVLGYQNLLAYSIIHIGAASLSGLMAVLLYIYPKKTTTWNHYPLIMIFAIWASLAIISILTVVTPSMSLLGEPITPYTVCTILTLILLTFAIRSTLNPPDEETKHPSRFRIAIIWIILTSLIVLGEIVNQLVLISYPWIESSPVGIIIIEVASLVIMFQFAFLTFLLVSKSRGTPSIELFTVIFLAMWILPNILKSFYDIWYTGWWVSEIYLFAGVLAGTPLLAWLYVGTMYEVAESHAKASMYADLLMHDITNFNQMMMTSFELLGSSDLPDKQRSKISDDGCNVVSLAEQLISNVRLLSESDRIREMQLESVNLVSVIVKALDLFGERISPGELKVEFNPNNADNRVLANDLLIHVFLNILYTVLEIHQDDRAVSIETTAVTRNGEDCWKTDIISYSKLEVKQKTLSSGILGITAARTIVESLNGILEVSKTQIDDSTVKQVFSVILPAEQK